MNNILGQSAYWVVNKALARLVGLEDALFISDLVSKHDYFKNRGELIDDGYFFNTVATIEHDTGLTYRKQKRVINNLVSIGILSTRLIGRPTKLYFKVNFGVIQGMLEITENKESVVVVTKVIKKPTIKYKDKFKNKDALRIAVDTVYAIYPSKCVVKKSSTGKSASSKLKIARLLRQHTSKELIEIIEWYVAECKKSDVYMKNFNTFLNNLPVIDEGEHVEDIKNKEEIIKLVKWLSSNYMMREPDKKSDVAAKKLEKLGYKNNDFLNQFLI